MEASGQGGPFLDGGEEKQTDHGLETVGCLLCGGRSFEMVVRARDTRTEFEKEFCIVRCVDCGLALTNPRPTQASIGHFYPLGYGPHAFDKPKRVWRGPLQERLERAVLSGFFGYPPQPPSLRTKALAVLGRARIRRRERRCAWIPYRGSGRLLDFGCGNGSFLNKMKVYGWSVQGVERSPSVAQRVQSETRIKIHVGSLPHPDIRPGTFDVITMWSALEHVSEPREVIRGAWEALAREGVLVVGVPNLESWSFRVFRQFWFGLDLPRHLVHFTPQTLSAMLQLEGFQIHGISHIGRDGWLRHSLRLTPRQGFRFRLLRALRWKPLALAMARWSEWTRQADYIRILARKE